MFILADKLKELRDAKKDAEQRVKELNSEIEDVDYELSEMMVNSETQNFTRCGTMFCLTTTTRASAMADKKDELYDALKRSGFGDLIYETVNANSLSAFVREQISENEDALPTWLEGLVSIFEKTSVGVRKAAK
ncbi:MAG: hypothetical protein Q8N36_02765 [bacterium]|nr:hypothetical protein [bacterium]